jgi:amino acid adenylation domain-containing protein
MGKSSPLPALPIQFADFAQWQRAWVQGAEAETQLAYWQKKLAGSPSVLALPSDRPRPARQSFQGAAPLVELPLHLCEALRAWSRQEGVTLFMTMLTAFVALLWRYTGQHDICVGSGIANRRRRETEGLIGMIINNLVLRTELSGNPTVRQLLGRVRETTLEAYAHQDVPFDKVVEALQPERNLSHNPLYQVMFGFHDAPMPDVELPGLNVSVLVGLSNGSAKFDLNVIVIPHFVQHVGLHPGAVDAAGLTLLWEYSTDLFDAPTISRMIGHYQALLEGMVANPQQHIAALPLLTEVERRQLLVEWNDTRRDYPQHQCLHRLFEAQVQQTPDAVAVVFEDASLSYQELDQRANQLAHHLRQRGVGPETVVAIRVAPSLDMLIGLLGILKAGGAYVPLDPAEPKARLAFMLEDTQAAVLLTQQRLVEDLPAHAAQVVCLDADWEVITRESEENPQAPVTSHHLAYVLYTSGSTGIPKGVMVEHRSLVNYLHWVNDGLLGDTVHHLPTTTRVTFDASLKQLFAPLLRGSDVWGLPGDVVIQPNVLLAALGKRRQVGLNCVPLLWKAVLEAIESRQAVPPVESLTALFLGGDRLDKELVDRSFAVLPQVQIWNLYGPTETAANAIVARLAPGDEVTIGQPISNTQAYVLDRYLQPVPVGVPGELYIGGDSLSRGYRNRPELTAEQFIPNPFSQEPGARLYKTGDLARYRPDGNIEYLGRLDDQVKIRGFRIELGEIEGVLRQYPGVQEVVVLASGDEPGDPAAALGVGKRLVAYMVADQEHAPTTTALRRYVQEKLPSYMMPSVFMRLDALPLTPTGKVDRQALPAPDWSKPELHGTFVSPRTPVETRLANIWAAVLGRERVGIHDDFFALGGHSLLATQVMSRLHSAFQVALPLPSLFETPTVAGLAETIEATLWAVQSAQATTMATTEEREEMEL